MASDKLCLLNLRDKFMVRPIEIPPEKLAAFCRKWKIKEFALFGSALREDFNPHSDVDVLVTFEPGAPWSLYNWPDMTDELKDIFGRNVDLIEKAGLRNPYRRHAILTTREVIYVA